MHLTNIISLFSGQWNIVRIWTSKDDAWQDENSPRQDCFSRQDTSQPEEGVGDSWDWPEERLCPFCDAGTTWKCQLQTQRRPDEAIPPICQQSVNEMKEIWLLFSSSLKNFISKTEGDEIIWLLSGNIQVEIIEIFTWSDEWYFTKLFMVNFEFRFFIFNYVDKIYIWQNNYWD